MYRSSEGMMNRRIVSCAHAKAQGGQGAHFSQTSAKA